MDSKTKHVMISVLVGLAVIVILQNTDVVGFRFLFWKFSMSRILLFPLLFLAGLGAGYFWGRKHD